MKDFVLTAWTIDPADFRLRLILGGSIGRDLRPAAHPRLVGQVLLPEGAFQVTLLALDHLALDQVHHQRQEEDDPQSVPQGSYPGVDHGQREVGRVAAVAERTCSGQPRNGPVGAHRRVGVAHGLAPPASDQRPATYEWPADDARHAARQEGEVCLSIEYQPQEQWQQVDKRWRHLDARVVCLAFRHRYSFARFPQYNVLRHSCYVGEVTSVRELRFLLLPDYCDRAVGVPDHRIGDTAHQSPPHPPTPPAAYNYQPNTQAVGQVDDLFVCTSQPQVRLLDGTSCLLDSSYLFIKQPLCPAFEFSGFNFGLSQKGRPQLSDVNNV